MTNSDESADEYVDGETGEVKKVVRIDKLVADYVWARDAIDKIEANHIKPLEELKRKLEGTMLNWLQKTGQTSARTKAGLVTIVVNPSASCSDPDMFIDFVRENDAFELMDRRANKTACWEYANEHGGVAPPGVKLSSTRTVRVTKS